MPYISQKARGELRTNPLRHVETAGELNYAVTMAMLDADKLVREQDYKVWEATEDLIAVLIGLCEAYVAHMGLNYQILNDISGALTNAYVERKRRLGDHRWKEPVILTLEMTYLRFAIPFENTKIRENGDVEGYSRDTREGAQL